jgi:hypothetical protein
MNEIMFIIEDADEGGYIARALGASIFTEADSLDELHELIRDAVRCSNSHYGNLTTVRRPRVWLCVGINYNRHSNWRIGNLCV